MLRFLLTQYLKTAHRGQSRVLTFLKNTSVTRTLPIKTTTGLNLEAEWTDWAGLYLLRHGCIEPETSKLLLQLLSQGQTFLDVGAHIGYLSLIAAQKVGPSGRVVAIEPQPRNCEKLLAGSVKNSISNITLFCAAAGSESGMIRLLPQAESDHSSLSLLKDVSTDVFGFVVPIIKLEDALSQAGCEELDVLKMDIEGFEIEAAKGLNWSGRFRPRHVISEALCGTPEERKRSVRFIDFMKSLGYRHKDVRGKPLVNMEDVVESNLWFQSV